MKKLAVLLLAGTTACSFANSIISNASDAAGRGIGNAVGNKVAADATAGMPQGASMNAAYLNVFLPVIFQYAFSSGGYEVAQVAYKPGEYTRWTGAGHNAKQITLERAYLADDGKGHQWWKIKWTDEEQKTVILEGLLDPAAKKFVRMRAKFPDDAEAKELPVDESTYYHPPTRLTKESIEGATKGLESVTVPAGTFKAKHVVFGGLDGTHEWWLEGKIPGGTVRQLLKAPKKASSEDGASDDARWDLSLAAYGKDAKSELGSL